MFFFIFFSPKGSINLVGWIHFWFSIIFAGGVKYVVLPLSDSNICAVEIHARRAGVFFNRVTVRSYSPMTFPKLG